MSRRRSIRARHHLAHLEIAGINQITDRALTACEVTDANLNWAFGTIDDAQAFRWPMLGRDRTSTNPPEMQVLFPPRRTTLVRIGDGNLHGELSGAVEAGDATEAVYWDSIGRPRLVSGLFNNRNLEFFVGTAINDRRVMLVEGFSYGSHVLFRFQLRGLQVHALEILELSAFKNFPAGARVIEGTGLNHRGAACGMLGYDSGYAVPFVWMPGETQPIKLRSYIQGMESRATAISDSFEVVGYSHGARSLGQQLHAIFQPKVRARFEEQPMLWPGSNFSVMPPFVNRRPFVYPTRLGGFGPAGDAMCSAELGRFVVGTMEVEDGEFHAFLAVDGTVLDLNDLLPEASQGSHSRWRLLDAISVLAIDGGSSPYLVIVGNGRFQDREAAYCMSLVGR